ncbi:MAG: TonB-dependent receptor [Bacteroidetes bacterium]|nr:TonB-dependent receptor [Bacteroidota bacterium]
MEKFIQIKRFVAMIIISLIVLVTGHSSAMSQKISLTDTVTKAPDTIYRELNEVVISATRVSKRIIDIPYSVVRINYSNFKYDRKIGANDMLSSVPGLFLQSRYGDHDVRFSIRGFGSRSNSGVRGIRILLDDIPESEPDGQTRLEALDFNSIGRIEIVKGNASSLYTNAPGGVANFMNDLDFDRSSVVQFNQFGSFGLHKNGFKAAIKTDKYRFLTTYSYVNYDGYRQHNNEYWHILNMVLEATPSIHTKLSILGYFVDGAIKLPGSLTKSEFDADPYQADQRSIDRDEKRITTKGRVGIRYDAIFGGNLNNEIEITAYGTIKFFERTAADYRIINRYGLGLSARYIHKCMIGSRHNEFSVGGDLFTQPARIEYYKNIYGAKGDQIDGLESEDISNKGFYLSNNFEILKEKMFVLLTARYDNVLYSIAEQILPSRTDRKPYSAVTPKLALNYKITPMVSIYTSYGLSFDAPAANEMGSPDPFLFNPDLKPQESGNFEVGIKGNILRWEKDFFRRLSFEVTLFNIRLNNEIIPYEVLGEVYYRNAAKTNRRGAELGAQLEILPNLNFGVSYTWSAFDYLTYEAQTIELDTGSFIISNKDFSGNIVPSVPVNNLYLSLAYSLSIGKHLNIFARASYQGISGMYVDDANSDKTKGYNLLNGLLGIDLKFGNFNLMASGGVNNIFNEVYVGFTNTNSANKRYYEAGAPRDYFVSLNLGYTF